MQARSDDGGMRVLNALKAFYNNLRIKYKIILLISLTMFIIGGVTYAMQQYTFEAYDEEVYVQSASALNNASLGIENELKRLEKLTFTMATDASLQSYLTIIQQGGTDYDNFLIAASIRNRLLSLGGLDKYVLSIHLFDVHGKEYTTGNSMITSSSERIKEIRAETAKEQGAISFISPGHGDEALIAGREIRMVSELDLSYLGNLSFRLDVDRLFRDFAKGMDTHGAQFLIMDGDKTIYPAGEPYTGTAISSELSGQRGFQIVRLNEQRYFITHVPSGYTNWTYYNVIPFNEIFKGIEKAKRTIFIIYGMIYLLVILFALGFARGITGPIERLNSKMKRVQLGHLDAVIEDQSDARISMDEAGQLQRNFRIMVERINELINENYVKQLSIKDTEFKALQAQINPHFLYNTLESINWSAKVAGHKQISQMVEALGFLLRSSISSKAPLISLDEELNVIRNYVTIQKIRFEERLEYEDAVPQELKFCLLPKLALQPLVENAINYGMEQMTEPCRITVSAYSEGGLLFVTVTDNGPGMDTAYLQQLRAGEIAPRGTGIGLRNIEERIKMLFGDDYGLELYSEKDQGTQVKLRLPLEMGDADV